MRTAVLLIAAASLIACSDKDPGDVSQKTPPQASTTTGVAPPSPMTPTLPPRSAAPAPATQEVHLLEYSIHMPDTLSSGHLTFRIENAGKEVHGFEIEGNGQQGVVNIQSIDKIQRGDTKTLDVDLKPGTYTIYCPVDGHKGKGMTKTLTVK